jgi:hypothetical protein
MLIDAEHIAVDGRGKTKKSGPSMKDAQGLLTKLFARFKA